jgi:tetratricopeptide (TPR) repeat protein
MSLNDGLALIRRHRFDEALALLATEVRAHPEDPYASYYLAFAFLGAQDPQPAGRLLSKLVEAHPDFTDAATLLGLARIRSSDFAGASAAYQSVLKRQPKNAAALLGLGMIHYWRRETEAAEDYLDRALREDPNARDAVVFKADLRFAAGDIPEAVNLLRDARHLPKPALPEVSDFEISDRLTRYEAALAPLKQTRTGLPPYPAWVSGLVAVMLALVVLAAAGLPGALGGLQHYQAGKQRLAAHDAAGCLEEMQQAVGAVPTSPKAWAYEAYCHLLDGNRAAGLSAWATAVSFESHVQLDSPAEQQDLINRLRKASRPGSHQ